MTRPDQPDPASPALHRTEAELNRTLDEVCHVDDVAEESTGELERLDEALRTAASMTEQAIALRRQRRADTEHPTATMAAPNAEARESMREVERTVDGTSREFEDEGARRWRVWAVTPGQARPIETARRYLGDFARGWLVFETLDGSARRRLANYPADWHRRGDAELRALLAQAVEARRRGS